MKATDNDDKEGSNDGGGEENAILLNSHVVQSLQRKLNKQGAEIQKL